MTRPLRPQHFSAIGKNMKPFKMERTAYPDVEARECIEGIAIDIFTDCTNAGCTFQQSLAAILNSGMEFAIQSLKEDQPHD